jgi:ribosomal protein S27E
MQRFACSACGAERVFDPPSGQLRCTGCATLEPIQGAGDASEHDLDQALAQAAASATGHFSTTALQITCGGCGATVEFEPPLVAGQCSFCGAKLVAQAQAADPLLAPGAILPFATRQEQANQQVRGWIESRWFAPNALRRLALVQGLNGVYVPFWSFSADTVSDYTGERGDAYYENVTRQMNQQTVTERVRRVRWNHAQGRVEVRFTDLLVPATKSVQLIQLNDLDPWDLENLTAYDPAYLAGFQAQHYQTPLAEGFATARGLMRPRIESAVRRDIGGDEQQVHALDTRFRQTSFRHVLLPIWIGAYHFNGKVFQIMVNARTGEVQGDRPYSAVKITLVVLAIALAIVLVVAMQQR